MTDQLGLYRRYRDRDGEIGRKHGNTRIAALRRIYGRHFAPGFADDAELSDVLASLDEPSLSRMVHDHEYSHLAGKIARG